MSEIDWKMKKKTKNNPIISDHVGVDRQEFPIVIAFSKSYVVSVDKSPLVLNGNIEVKSTQLISLHHNNISKISYQKFEGTLLNANLPMYVKAHKDEIITNNFWYDGLISKIWN